MNTLRYKTEYYDQTVDILKNLPNMVDLPSDIFFDISGQFELGRPDKAKLERLIKRTYTMLAIEDEKVLGLAGMDNEGNIGLFIAREGDGYTKACRLLSNALERRAAKRELPYLFVLQTQKSEQTFLNLGYAPFDNGSGAANDAILAKQIEPENKIDIKPEQVREIKLNPNKKITVEGKTSIVPAFFLGLASFFLFLLIAITVGKMQAGTLSDVDPSAYTPIAVFVGIFFAAAVALCIAYTVRASRLKREVLSMRVTNGVILSLAAMQQYDPDESYRRKTSRYEYVSLTYAYYDENMQRKETHYRHRYYSDYPNLYEGQEIIIAHSGEKSYILHKFTTIHP